jgi:hypothetical protein
MPPLQPGKIVSQTGKIVNASKPTPRGGPGAKIQKSGSRSQASKAPKPTPRGGPGAKIQKTGSLSTSKIAKKYKEAGKDFKGVGVVPYLNKKGEDAKKTTKKPKPLKLIKKKVPGVTYVPDETGLVPTTPAMEPTPTPAATTTTTATEPKTPTRNVTDISSLVPQFNAEEIQKILFENLSAIELSKIERHDTIEGINQKYSIISNLSEIRKKYEATRQLTVMDKFSPLTQVYAINIEDKIPQEDYLILQNLNLTYKYLDENNEEITREKGYYYIDTNGDLVIELINLERNEQVEVLIDTNGTIYKIEEVES